MSVEYGLVISKDVMVPMRDGILLATDLHRPGRDGELVPGRWPTIVCITPYDKTSLGVIERAIRDSDLGVNPTNDGTVIRVSFPQLTEERRKEFIKVARHKAEDSRVSIRNVRRHAKDSLDKLAKDGEAGEDDVARAEKELEKVTHKYVAAIDDLLKHKETELLEV